MATGETYGHIDSEIGNGSRVKLKNDGTWEFVDEEQGFGGWVQRNGNQFILGVITSIIAAFIFLYLIRLLRISNK